MSDGLDFTQVSIEKLSDGEFTERLVRELTALAVIVSDAPTYGDKARGRVSVTFDVIAAPDKRMGAGVLIQASWKVATPKALPESVAAWVRGGRLVMQQATQIDLAELQQRMADERAGNAAPEPVRAAPGGSPRARRETTVTPRAQRAPANVQGTNDETEEEQS